VPFDRDDGREQLGLSDRWVEALRYTLLVCMFRRTNLGDFMNVKLTTAALLLIASAASSASAASYEECELIKGRIDKYAELLDALVFLDEDFVRSNPSFNELHKYHVSYEILGGELDQIREAKAAVERLCR